MKVFGYIVVIKRSGGDYTSFPLTTTNCSIGRNQDCDIRVQLPTVSKHHCYIKVNSSGIAYVYNASLSNPTLLNDNSLSKNEGNLLHHQDIISIADRHFRWEYPEGSNVQEKLKNLSTPKKLASLSTPKNKSTPYKESAKRSNIENLLLEEKGKRVSFGPYLSPEQYDKKMPPSTPIRKGQTPLENDFEASLKKKKKLPPFSLQNSLIPENTVSNNGLLKRKSPTPVKLHLAKSLGIFNKVKSSPLKSVSEKQTPKSQKQRRSVKTPSKVGDKGKKRKLSISPSPARKKRKMTTESKTKTPKSQKVTKSAKKSSKKVKTFAEALKAGIMKKKLNKTKTPKGKVTVLKLQSKKKKIVKEKLPTNDFANSQEIPKLFSFGVQSTGHIDSPANIIIHKKLHKTPKVYKKGRKFVTQSHQVVMNSPDLTGIDFLQYSELSTQTSSSKISLNPNASTFTPQLSEVYKSSPVTSSRSSTETFTASCKGSSKSLSKTPLMNKPKSKLKTPHNKIRSLSISPSKKNSGSEKVKYRSLSLNAANRSKMSPKTLVSQNSAPKRTTRKTKSISGIPKKQNPIQKASMRSKSLPKSPKSFSATTKTLKVILKSPVNRKARSLPKTPVDSKATSVSTTTNSPAYEIPHSRSRIHARSKSLTKFSAAATTASKVQPRPKSISKISSTPKASHKSKSPMKSPDGRQSVLKTPHSFKSKSVMKTPESYRSNSVIKTPKSSKSIPQTPKSTKSKPVLTTPKSSKPKSVLETSYNSATTILDSPRRFQSNAVLETIKSCEAAILKTSKSYSPKTVLITPDSLKSKSVMKTPNHIKPSNRSRSTSKKTISSSLSKLSASRSLSSLILPDETKQGLQTPKILNMISESRSDKIISSSKQNPPSETSNKFKLNLSVETINSNTPLLSKSAPIIDRYSTPKGIERNVSVTPINYAGFNSTTNSPSRKCSKLSFKDNYSPRSSMSYMSDQPFSISPSSPSPLTPLSGRKSRASVRMSPSCSPVTPPPNLSLLKSSNKKKLLSSSMNMSVGTNGTAFDFSTLKTPNISADNFVSPLGTPMPIRGVPDSLARLTQQSSGEYLDIPVDADLTSYEFDSQVTPIISTDKFVSPLSCNHQRDAVINSMRKRYVGKSPLKDCSITNSIQKLFENKDNDLTGAYSLLESETLQVEKICMNSVESELTPKIDHSNISEARRLLRTTPRAALSPVADYTNVRGVKRLLNHKSPISDYSNIHGLKKLLLTPKNKEKEICKPNSDYDLVGLRKLLKSPRTKLSHIPDYTDTVGIRSLYKSTRISNQGLGNMDLEGVSELLTIPATPVNSPVDVSSVSSKCNLSSSKNDLTISRKILTDAKTISSHSPKVLPPTDGGQNKHSSNIKDDSVIANIPPPTGIKRKLLPESPATVSETKKSVHESAIKDPIWNVANKLEIPVANVKDQLSSKSPHPTEITKIASPAAKDDVTPMKITRGRKKNFPSPTNKPITPSIESPNVKSTVTPIKIARATRKKLTSPVIESDNPRIASLAAKDDVTPMKITRGRKKKFPSPTNKPITPSIESPNVKSTVTPIKIARATRKKLTSPVIESDNPSIFSTVESLVTSKKMTRGSRKKNLTPVLKADTPSIESLDTPKKMTRGSRKKNSSPALKADTPRSTPHKTTRGSRKKLASPVLKVMTPSIASPTVSSTNTPKKITKGRGKKGSSPAHQIVSSSIISTVESLVTPKKMTRGSRKKNSTPVLKADTPSITSPTIEVRRTPKKVTRGSRKKPLSPAIKLATLNDLSPVQEKDITRKATRGMKKKVSSPIKEIISVSVTDKSATTRKATRGRKPKAISPIMETHARSALSPATAMKATRGRKAKAVSPVKETLSTNTLFADNNMETAQSATRGRKKKPQSPIKETPVASIESPKPTKGKKRKSSSQDDFSPPLAKRALRTRKK